MKVVIAIDSFKEASVLRMPELPSVKGSTGYSQMQKFLSALWLTAEKVLWKLSQSVCTAGSVQ